MIPMTRDSRAAVTTSLVTVLSWLISMMRWIWAISRVVSRKLPPVMRMMAAQASRVVDSGLVVVQESDAAVELRVAGQSAFDAGHADEDQAGDDRVHRAVGRDGMGQSCSTAISATWRWMDAALDGGRRNASPSISITS